jgi:radical SAM superfamily enzyme YgiQ (UPF0313 family)
MGKRIVHFILPGTSGLHGDFSHSGNRASSPVAGLLALSAETPEDQWKMILTDENTRQLDYEIPCDLVAISFLTGTAGRAYSIADRFRQKGIQVVLGGVHASFLPHEALEHGDGVVVGEGEPVWRQVLKDAAGKGLKGIYTAKREYDLREMKPAKRNLLQGTSSRVYDSLQTSRGCSHECTFCCERGMNGNRFRFRPIGKVIEEIKALPQKEVVFCDPDLFGRPFRAYKLFEAMVPLGKRWQGTVSTGWAENDELLAMARKSGCTLLNVGFESIWDPALAQCRKKSNRPERYGKLVEKIHSHGIMVHAFSIFGFDAEDESTFEKTTRFWMDAGVDACTFSILTPYPGTPLYHQLHAQGRITSYDWSRYHRSDVVFEPKRMSQETLKAGFHYACKGFYSVKSFLYRFPFLGERSRVHWITTNAHMRKRNRAEKMAATSALPGDVGPPPMGKFAAHVLPGASGTPHRDPGSHKRVRGRVFILDRRTMPGKRRKK